MVNRLPLPRKWPHNQALKRRILETMAPKEGETYLINRNPRNLEFMRLANRPAGYRLEMPFSHGTGFWNRLVLKSTQKHVTAQMVHFQNGPVVQASTTEWAIKKQLFKTSDFCAYTNLARVFAQRCLESGFIEMEWNTNDNGVPGGKIEAFLKVLEDSGLVLSEARPVHTTVQTNHYVGRKSKPFGDWEEH